MNLRRAAEAALDTMRVIYGPEDRHVKELSAALAEPDELALDMEPGPNSYVGWTIVGHSADGSVLLDGPGGSRRRVWFNSKE